MVVMLDTLTQMVALAADLVERPAWSSSDDDLTTALTLVGVLSSRLSCITAGLVGEVDDRGIPSTQGASSTVVWLRDHTRVSVAAAKRLVELSRLVDARPVLRDALAAGAITSDQAAVIGAVVGELPGEVDPVVVDKAETLLVGYAARFEPSALRGLGNRILAHVAPDLADEVLRRRLECDEVRARVSRTFSISQLSGGRARLSGWLDTESAAIVAAAIDPLCKPTPGSNGSDERTPGQRRADALTDVCRLALATGELPDSGGERAHLSVTVDYDVVLRQLGVGTLDTGQTISAGSVRRLACDAQILPIVLDGDGAVLDVGRTRRLYAGAVRRALIARDGGCAFPGCDRPPRWCDGHHIRSWLDGGPTNLDNGVLLCRHHHRVIHHGEWVVRIGADRRPEFVPSALIDPARTPRRNIYHPRP